MWYGRTEEGEEHGRERTQLRPGVAVAQLGREDKNLGACNRITCTSNSVGTEGKQAWFRKTDQVEATVAWLRKSTCTGPPDNTICAGSIRPPKGPHPMDACSNREF